MFVDDVIAASVVETGVKDRVITRGIATKLLGDEAVEDDKTPKIDVIGCMVDKQARLVTMTRCNFLKTTYCFFSVDVDAMVPVRDMERMESYASRYGMLIPVLRPFTRPLYAAYSGLSRSVSIRLKTSAK